MKKKKFKSGSSYREVIKTPPADYCVVVRSASSNVLIKQVVDTCRKMAPNLIKECPLKGVSNKY